MYDNHAFCYDECIGAVRIVHAVAPSPIRHLTPWGGTPEGVGRRSGGGVPVTAEHERLRPKAEFRELLELRLKLVQLILDCGKLHEHRTSELVELVEALVYRGEPALHHRREFFYADFGHERERE